MTGRLGWTRHRVKFVADINRETLGEATDPNFTFDYVDIGRVTQGVIDSAPLETVFGVAPSRARRLATPGDTIVSTVRTYLRAVATVEESEIPQVFSTGFAVLHPRRSVVHPRFLSYYLQSDEFVDRIVANSVGVSYPAINASDLAGLDLWLPDVHVQRAISDFLDCETAQIDAMIEAQRGLLSQLGEHREAVRDELIATSSPEVALKRLADVTVGIVVTPSAWYADDGVPALRGLNVRDERLDLGSLVYLTDEGHALHRKSRLSAGDVVVVRTGQSGTAACISADMDGWNAIDLLIVRPRAELDGEYLAMALNSGKLRQRVRASTVGAIQGHFNVEALSNLALPYPTLRAQAECLSVWRDRRARIDAMAHAANDAITLMQERRSALISAAVTGRIDPRTGKESVPEKVLEFA